MTYFNGVCGGLLVLLLASLLVATLAGHGMRPAGPAADGRSLPAETLRPCTAR